MSSRTYISVIVSFFVYVLVQVLLLKNFILFDTAFCFVYVAFILLLPLEMGPLLLMFVAFATGLSVDLFYDSLGVNAAASVFIAFVRPYWLRLITPRGGYEDIEIPNLKTMDFGWFFTYSLPLVLYTMLYCFIWKREASPCFFTPCPKCFFLPCSLFSLLCFRSIYFIKRLSDRG